MTIKRLLIVSLTIAGLLTLSGCVESPEMGQAPPFEDQELDACLAIIVDMSGSFHDQWNDRAYDLFLKLSDRFFTEGIGANTKIVIGQMSGNDQILLFEGRPQDLKTRFRSPQELSQFLKEAADPAGSHVYTATRMAVDYLTRMPGVTENTRLLTVILSDMRDSETYQNIETSPRELLKASLNRYREKGGALALYFVAHSERQHWHGLLQEAGFPAGHYIVEGELSANPQLPRFD